MIDFAPPVGWLPVHLGWERGQPCLHWLHVGSERFVEPFFAGTIARCLRRPFSQLFTARTSMAALDAQAEGVGRVDPAGFIFHMSRCGSTLLGQMLARLPGNVVISEAPIIESILRSHAGRTDISDAQRARWLRGVIAALGQIRSGDERRLFVKFDCWHTIDLPLIHRAFPDVPWILLYRDPLEVLASQVRQPGAFTVPGRFGREVFGIAPDEAFRVSREDYLARIFAKICTAALAGRHLGRGLLVNYAQLPDALFETISPHLRIAWSAAERAAMNAATRVNAKTPHLPFAPDGAEKQALVTAPMRTAVEAWLAAPYGELEAVRRGERD